MKPDPRFTKAPREFWAYVRTLSEAIGYTDRKTHRIQVPSVESMVATLRELGVDGDSILGSEGNITDFGKLIVAYFEHRARCLNTIVEPLLMDGPQAKKLFQEVRKKYGTTLTVPMNKQKGKMRQPAYLTGMAHSIIRHCIGEAPCDFDPRKLTHFTQEGRLLRTLARRIDGAFPSTHNPIAVWEIKEYYYTTTFGSRVADGIYETLLDGMELHELHANHGIEAKHYLILDARYTWWECGRSYLCRVIDMLHMGFVDEVLFGREVVDRLPVLVREWMSILRQRNH
jgi:hypothetical protein